MGKIFLLVGRFILKKVMPSAVKIMLGKLDGAKFDGKKRLLGAGIMAVGIGMYVAPHYVPELEPMKRWALDVTLLGGSGLTVGTAHWLTKKESEIEKRLSSNE